jgi:hypothetical protein
MTSSALPCNASNDTLSQSFLSQYNDGYLLTELSSALARLIILLIKPSTPHNSTTTATFYKVDWDWIHVGRLC